MHLTAEQIIKGLISSGGVLLWSIDLGISQPKLSAAITSWRQRATLEERREVAHALRLAKLDHRTIVGATGVRAVESRPVPPLAPSLTKADRAADAAHVAAWGHV